MNQELTIDHAKAHALAIAANDEDIDRAVSAGRLTPLEGTTRKLDDAPRIHALVEKAIADFLARDYH